MAINASDISVATNGDIRYTGAASGSYTVLELHRFLQDLADNATSSGDDLVDITSDTPSERSTDNIITLLGDYNIDDTLAEHLFDGSISQTSGDEIYSGLKVLGAVNNTDSQLMVVQENSASGLTDFYQYTTTPATPFWGTQSTGGLNGDSAAGILLRCLIKSRVAGGDIDGKRIRVQARHWGDTYDFFNVTLGQGESVAAIGTTPDAQNTTNQSSASAYTHVTNTEGYQLIDLNNGNGDEPYYSQWTYGADTSEDGLKGVWEFGKDLTGNGTAKSIHGLGGELFLGVTHEYPFGTETGNAFVEDDIISWGTGTTAGTGLLLALNDEGATGTVWMQLLTGVAPTNGETINNELADGTHDLTSSPTSRTIPKVFLGSYTGTLIGAFGIGIDPDDLTSSDSVQDLLGVTQTPPNNVTFTVSGVVSGQDYVLVGPKTGSSNAFFFDQLSLDTALTSGSGTTVVVTEAIPDDTPSTGTIRVLSDAGSYMRLPYSSWATSTFTLSGSAQPDAAATSGNNTWISYIDVLADDTSEAFTTIFDVSRALFIRVRDGGAASPIKTFETPGTLGSAGGSAVASRISDE